MSRKVGNVLIQDIVLIWAQGWPPIGNLWENEDPVSKLGQSQGLLWDCINIVAIKTISNCWCHAYCQEKTKELSCINYSCLVPTQLIGSYSVFIVLCTLTVFLQQSEQN